MNSPGRLTSKTNEKANTKLDNKFSLKWSHSIAETLWKHGLEWLSIRLSVVLVKWSSFPSALIITAPVSDSAKWCKIGALCISEMRASSRAVGMQYCCRNWSLVFKLNKDHAQDKPLISFWQEPHLVPNADSCDRDENCEDRPCYLRHYCNSTQNLNNREGAPAQFLRNIQI